jgi:hypothetical protein
MSLEDFSESLADEVRTDMANNFFGDRVELEENIRLLYKTADLLREKETKVYEKAAFLNYLMLTPQAARSIYRASGIDTGVFAVEGDVTENALPAFIPSALTRKGEYVKFVLWAYETLENACQNYICGTRTGHPEKRHFEADDADYRLIQNMCTLINEEIDRINHRCLPSQILQIAKKFDPAAQAKEYVTGGGTYYGDECTLNENLAFKHIEFGSLNVKELPELAPVEKVRGIIVKEAKANYAQNKARIHEMLSYVRRRFRSSVEK